MGYHTVKNERYIKVVLTVVRGPMRHARAAAAPAAPAPLSLSPRGRGHNAGRAIHKTYVYRLLHTVHYSDTDTRHRATWLESIWP